MPPIPASVERELGTTRTYGSSDGWPWDLSEDTPELQWPQNVIVYDRMRRTDSQVIGTLYGVTLPLRQAHWYIDPRDADPAKVEQLCSDLNLPMAGMDPPTAQRTRDRFSFRQHLREALLVLPYGHMPFEQVYRIVDGMARLRKLAPRMPRTLSKINTSDDGGLAGIVQTNFEGALARQPEVEIGVDRLVYYCNEREGGAWQGNSILRSSYKNWTLKERLLRVASMTIERNGMGIPAVDAPQGTSQSQLQELAKMAEAYRAGDKSGLALPYGARLRLIGVEGSIPDALPLIRYHDEQITRPMLEMFMQLGMTQTGSRALGSSFLDFFAMALDAHAGQIADTFTMYQIEDYFDLNWGPNEPAPALACQTIDAERDIDPAALQALITAQAITVDDDLEAFMRQRFKLPPRNTDQLGRTPAAPAPASPIARRGRRPFVYE